MWVQPEADYRPLMADVVQSLVPLVKHHKPTSRPLHLRVSTWNVTVVKRWVELASLEEIANAIDVPSIVGTSLCMAAALKKDHEAEGREMVCLLLAAGADATAQDTQHGRTTLHTAAMANDVELVKIILDAEVDVNLRNVHNTIPLHVALAYLIVYNIHWHALLFGLLCCGDMFT